jgi:thymidylate synthase (FAD)
MADSSNSSNTLRLADGIGSVELLEVFGSDVTVVNAARVSFGKEVTVMDEKDVKLLNYLAKHNHVSPFFHPQIRFRLKMPIFIAREWYRHQIGLSRNEVSRRYVDSKVECWVPQLADLRERDPKAKQGSKATPVDSVATVHCLLKEATDSAVQTYEALLAAKVAPEIARTVLPQSMYTEFIETGSLAAYARICALRLDPTAQKEIQVYASFVDQLLSKAFPHSWKALQQQQTQQQPQQQQQQPEQPKPQQQSLDSPKNTVISESKLDTGSKDHIYIYPDINYIK